jgi:hypothetical protein
VLRTLEREDLPTAIANRFKVTQVWPVSNANPSQVDGTPGSLPRDAIDGHGWSR